MFRANERETFFPDILQFKNNINISSKISGEIRFLVEDETED